MSPAKLYKCYASLWCKEHQNQDYCESALVNSIGTVTFVEI